MLSKLCALLLAVNIGNSFAVGIPENALPVHELANVVKDEAKEAEKALCASDKIRILGSIFVLGSAVYGSYRYFFPDEENREIYMSRVRGIKILRAEQELYDCVVQNAEIDIAQKELPSICKSVSDMLALAAGYEPVNEVKKEYIQATKHLAAHPPLVPQKQQKKGMSKTKKVVIGGFVILGVAGGAIIAAPIVLPGTLIAAKATAVTAAVKSTAVAAAAKVAAAGSAVKTATVAGVASAVENVKANVAAMDTVTKINKAADVISYTRYGFLAANVANEIVYWKTGRPIYATLQHELELLLEKKKQRKSLAEQIKEFREKSS